MLDRLGKLSLSPNLFPSQLPVLDIPTALDNPLVSNPAATTALNPSLDLVTDLCLTICKDKNRLDPVMLDVSCILTDAHDESQRSNIFHRASYKTSCNSLREEGVIGGIRRLQIMGLGKCRTISGMVERTSESEFKVMATGASKVQSRRSFFLRYHTRYDFGPYFVACSSSNPRRAYAKSSGSRRYVYIPQLCQYANPNNQQEMVIAARASILPPQPVGLLTRSGFHGSVVELKRRS